MLGPQEKMFDAPLVLHTSGRSPNCSQIPVYYAHFRSFDGSFWIEEAPEQSAKLSNKDCSSTT